jgi:hypothetical protein
VHKIGMDIEVVLKGEEFCRLRLHARHALKSLEAHLPLDGQKLARLDMESIQDIDQLVLRYSKLQDSMAASFFRRFLKFSWSRWKTAPCWTSSIGWRK